MPLWYSSNLSNRYNPSTLKAWYSLQIQALYLITIPRTQNHIFTYLLSVLFLNIMVLEVFGWSLVMPSDIPDFLTSILVGHPFKWTKKLICCAMNRAFLWILWRKWMGFHWVTVQLFFLVLLIGVNVHYNVIIILLLLSSVLGNHFLTTKGNFFLILGNLIH